MGPPNLSLGHEDQRNSLPTRRDCLRRSAGLGLAVGLSGFATAIASDQPASPATQAARKLKICLSPGMLGIRANMKDLIELASRFGFEAIEPSSAELMSMSDDAIARLRDEIKAKGLVVGAVNTNMPIGQGDEEFKALIGRLPDMAAALQKIGTTRAGTYIMSGDQRLTYLENFRRHAAHVGEVAKVLADHGMRFGLEYLGPKTIRGRMRFPFIHTMKEMRELIAAVGAPNVGLTLDSWHWYTAGDTAADIRALRNEDVVAVHLNDAPAGIPVDQQVDSHRALPATTGVIDIGGFLGALIAIGYDGPVAAEPFDAQLRRLPREEAVKRTIDAIHKALDRV